MENEAKLFKFLLLDNKVLKDDFFIEHNVKKIYSKLFNKYHTSLSVLEYLKSYAEVALEDLKKDGSDDSEDIKKVIKEIIKKNSIEFEYLSIYVKSMSSEDSDKYKKASEFIMENCSDEKRNAIQQIYNYYIEIYKIENCINAASFYERLIRNIENLEKIFFKSFAFCDLFDEKEWCGIDSRQFVQTLEMLAVILMQENNYEESTDPSDNNYISNWNKSKDDIQYDVWGVENEIDREILFSFAVVEGLLKIYGRYNLLSAKSEKRKYRKNIQIGYEDKEEIEKLISFLQEQIQFIHENDKTDVKQESDEYKQKKQDLKLIEDVFVYLLKSQRISRELELEYMNKFISSDIDFMRYQKMITKLENLIKVFDSNRNTNFVKMESQEEKRKDREHREINEAKRHKAFCDMVEIYKSIYENKRTAMNKVRARLNRRIKQDMQAHSELIDESLYKNIFLELEKDTKNIGKKIKSASDIESNYTRVRENANKFYIYKDIGIMTLTFPNTDIDKYKKAAIIIDKEDISKIYLNSGKRCWTFKDGLECTHGVYKTKTMKPDKITTNAGKLVLLDTLKGVRTKKILNDENVECKRVYYTNSHKFDLRAEKIVENIGKSKSANEEKYYSGKIRIEKEGELEDCKTVCFNNMENHNEAAILYFDDAECFINFLDKL